MKKKPFLKRDAIRKMGRNFQKYNGFREMVLGNFRTLQGHYKSEVLKKFSEPTPLFKKSYFKSPLLMPKSNFDELSRIIYSDLSKVFWSIF